MGKALVEMKLSEGGPAILIETTASEGSSGFVDAASGDGLILKAEKTLTNALQTIGPLAELLLSELRSVTKTPKSAVVEFGIKFGAKGNVIIAGGEAEANCKITLSWDLESALP